MKEKTIGTFKLTNAAICRKLHVSYLASDGMLNRVVLDCIISYPFDYALNSESLKKYIIENVHKYCILIIAWNDENN